MSSENKDKKTDINTGSCKVYYVKEGVRHEAVMSSDRAVQLMSYLGQIKCEEYGFTRIG